MLKIKLKTEYSLILMNCNLMMFYITFPNFNKKNNNNILMKLFKQSLFAVYLNELRKRRKI